MLDYPSFFLAVKSGAPPVRLQSLSAHEKLPWVAQGYGCFEFVTPTPVFEEADLYGFWFGAYPADPDAFYAFVSPEDVNEVEGAVEFFLMLLLEAKLMGVDPPSLSWNM